MRVAVIVVSMFVVATPSQASESCMTKTEARQHYGSVHIYWHGPNRCWDATPGRRYQVRRVQHKDDQVVQRKPDPPRRQDSKWQNSMSQMLADDEPVRLVGAQELARERASRIDVPAAGVIWSDRWVDVAHAAPTAPSPRAEDRPPSTQAAPIIEHMAEPPIAPRGVLILVLFTMVMTVGTVEVLLRNNFRKI
jgi:hypothetical protein